MSLTRAIISSSFCFPLFLFQDSVILGGYHHRRTLFKLDGKKIYIESNQTREWNHSMLRKTTLLSDVRCREFTLEHSIEISRRITSCASNSIFPQVEENVTPKVISVISYHIGGINRIIESKEFFFSFRLPGSSISIPVFRKSKTSLWSQRRKRYTITATSREWILWKGSKRETSMTSIHFSFHSFRTRQKPLNTTSSSDRWEWSALDSYASLHPLSSSPWEWGIRNKRRRFNEISRWSCSRCISSSPLLTSRFYFP